MVSINAVGLLGCLIIACAIPMAGQGPVCNNPSCDQPNPGPGMIDESVELEEKEVDNSPVGGVPAGGVRAGTIIGLCFFGGVIIMAICGSVFFAHHRYPRPGAYATIPFPPGCLLPGVSSPGNSGM